MEKVARKVAEIDKLIEKYKSKINSPDTSKVVKIASQHMIRDLEIYRAKISKQLN
ncbi:hypothetical protein BX659_10215 [Orenia metallireducens]|jgi:hypothetical protein|uniref:Uncharacterized protein n=1 Tax=Orenia metallireducens TaxID=1413210 RepID=A0A285F1R7_9FIRM|nr:hypothetical protein [Orenia metallireducens]PRX34700.1 hypothetical protein BX659_10215 [Orenia metallireducens]SNY05235.1 hypothetical protein SAMN06265827_10115 [Orenia metallireducens]